MIFWDTSAIVPLLLDQPGTSTFQAILERDPDMLVWWGTATEAQSAIARLERDGDLDTGDASTARRTLSTYQEFWSEVTPGDEVRDHAARLLLRHPLRAADALRLGAAMTWARARPDGHLFLTLDTRLADAARREGFALVG